MTNNDKVGDVARQAAIPETGDSVGCIGLSHDGSNRPNRLAAGQDPLKRRQILSGAEEVFMRMGFDAASMNDITREAGVSKGTIYVYFNNKEDLFEALCDEHRTTMFADLLKTLNKGFIDRNSFVEFGVAAVKLITSDIAIRAQRIVLGVSDRKPELSARFYERGPSKTMALLKSYLEVGIARGELRIPDVELATYQLWDLFLAGLYRPRLFGAMDKPPSDERILANVESAINIFFKAYGVR